MDTLRLQNIRAGHHTLRNTLAPIRPRLATHLRLERVPLLNRTLKRPFQPVTLQRASVNVDLTILPNINTRTNTRTRNSQLTVKRHRAHVRALPQHTNFRIRTSVDRHRQQVIRQLRHSLTIRRQRLFSRLRTLRRLLQIRQLVIFCQRTFRHPLTIHTFLRTSLRTVRLGIHGTCFTNRRTNPRVKRCTRVIRPRNVNTNTGNGIVHRRGQHGTTPISFGHTSLRKRTRHFNNFNLSINTMFNRR